MEKKEIKNHDDYVIKVLRKKEEEYIATLKKIRENDEQIKARIEKLTKIDQQKNEFMAMVSHELKTPIVPISGHCEMLLEPDLLGKLNEEQTSAIREIQKSCKILQKLIADMLDAQKLEMNQIHFNIKEIKLDEFMVNMYENLSSLMKDKEIQFTNTTKSNVIFKSDRDRLYQIFSNLVQNAVDFVPQKGGRIEIGGNYDGEQILFYVRDNGKGISPEDQLDLFKKFYQVDTSVTRKHGGTGIGLSICRGVINGLGGRIWVESEAEVETTFYFIVPKGDNIQ